MSDALLDAFVTFLRAERNLAPKTVDAYAMDVRDWLGELARRKIAVEAATRDDVLEHLAWLSRKGLAPRSRARHLAALRGFHRFLEDEKLSPGNPTDDLDTPKHARKLPIFLTLDEVEALLKAPDVSAVTGLRDRAMIEVLYATGLRVSELVKLGINDVNLIDGYVMVKAGGVRAEFRYSLVRDIAKVGLFANVLAFGEELRDTGQTIPRLGAGIGPTAHVLIEGIFQLDLFLNFSLLSNGRFSTGLLVWLNKVF